MHFNVTLLEAVMLKVILICLYFCGVKAIHILTYARVAMRIHDRSVGDIHLYSTDCFTVFFF